MIEKTIAELQHVTHRYGTTIALADVNLEIPARRMAGIIGPDGVGKSTLLALVSGVRRIQDGHVTVFEGDMENRAFRTANCLAINVKILRLAIKRGDLVRHNICSTFKIIPR